jgi:hypothetical protein
MQPALTQNTLHPPMPAAGTVRNANRGLGLLDALFPNLQRFLHST